MGRDKALITIEGRAMVRRVVEAGGSAGAASVITVGGDQAGIAVALQGIEATQVADRWPDEGPLGGILTALAAATTDLVLVVACDLLAPSASAMAATVGALARDPAAEVVTPVLDRQVEWLHAAWRRTTRVRVEERFRAGERAVHRAVTSAGLTVVPVPGIDPAGLADADTPADLTLPRHGCHGH